MNTPAPEPKPKRSRRMVVWMIAVPIAILLLALAGANWKTFHLAYAKHLMGTDDPDKQARGVEMVMKTHLREGMGLEEVRATLAPARVTDIGFLFSGGPLPLRPFTVGVEGDARHFIASLGFDEEYRLRVFSFHKLAPTGGSLPPGK